MKTLISRSESDEQIGFLAWFDAAFPGVRIFHIPNGGRKPKPVGQDLSWDGDIPEDEDIDIPF